VRILIDNQHMSGPIRKSAMKKKAGARQQLRGMCDAARLCILLVMFAVAGAIVVVAAAHSPTCSEGSPHGTAIGGMIRLRGCP
jgi:hypothetical protein